VLGEIEVWRAYLIVEKESCFNVLWKGRHGLNYPVGLRLFSLDFEDLKEFSLRWTFRGGLYRVVHHEAGVMTTQE